MIVRIQYDSKDTDTDTVIGIGYRKDRYNELDVVRKK